MGGWLSSLLEKFYSKRLELCIIGLPNSGKSTFATYIELGDVEKAGEQAPTVGLNVKVMTKGNVTCKIWDMGGQEEYRKEWGRYAHGCHAIVFVVDSQRPEELPAAKTELHRLLEDPELAKIPILFLANKIDLGAKLTEMEIIDGMNLEYITDNPWLLIPVSSTKGDNIDRALEFLLKLAEF